MDIVKSKLTRRNEILCRILEIEDLSKNVRKTQDRTTLILTERNRTVSMLYEKLRNDLVPNLIQFENFFQSDYFFQSDFFCHTAA